MKKVLNKMLALNEGQMSKYSYQSYRKPTVKLLDAFFLVKKVNESSTINVYRTVMRQAEQFKGNSTK
jgi:cob(I)alamin adenosyltransferase